MKLELISWVVQNNYICVYEFHPRKSYIQIYIHIFMFQINCQYSNDLLKRRQGTEKRISLTCSLGDRRRVELLGFPPSPNVFGRDIREQTKRKTKATPPQAQYGSKHDSKPASSAVS